jgi:hypothetical protein
MQLDERTLPVLQAIWLAAVSQPLLFDPQQRAYFEPYSFARLVLDIAKKIEQERTADPTRAERSQQPFRRPVAVLSKPIGIG